jgi:hypothetical protein
LIFFKFKIKKKQSDNKLDDVTTTPLSSSTINRFSKLNTINNNNNNPLEYPYSFWFSKRQAKGVSGATNYDANLKLVGTFSSVSLFLVLSNSMKINY